MGSRQAPLFVVLIVLVIAVLGMFLYQMRGSIVVGQPLPASVSAQQERAGIAVPASR